MIENQIYNLIIIQTIGPIIGDVLKNLINEHKTILIKLITFNSLFIFLGIYYIWKYNYDIKYFFKIW